MAGQKSWNGRVGGGVRHARWGGWLFALVVGVLPWGWAADAGGGSGGATGPGSGAGQGGQTVAKVPSNQRSHWTTKVNWAEEDMRALREAVRANDLAAAFHILSRDPRLLNAVPGDIGPGILQSVDYSGPTEMLELLLSFGADPNYHTKFGWQILTWIVFFYDNSSDPIGGWINTEVFEHYFEHPNYGLNDSLNGWWSAETLNPAALQLLLDHGAQYETVFAFPFNASALMFAAARKDPGLLQAFIARGADLTTEDAEGITLLHRAACSGSVVTVKELTSRGLSIHAKDRAGRTPLFYAALANDREMISYLLDAGADATLVDQQGRSVLHYLFLHTPAEIEELQTLLMAHGARYIRDRDGRTALSVFTGGVENWERLPGQRHGRFGQSTPFNPAMLYYYQYEQWLPGWLLLLLGGLGYVALSRLLRRGLLAGTAGAPAPLRSLAGRELKRGDAAVQSQILVRRHVQERLWVWLLPAGWAQAITVFVFVTDPLALAASRWWLAAPLALLFLWAVAVALLRNGWLWWVGVGIELAGLVCLAGAAVAALLMLVYWTDGVDRWQAGLFGLGMSANLLGVGVAARLWWNWRGLRKLVKRLPKVDWRGEETGMGEARVEEGGRN